MEHLDAARLVVGLVVLGVAAATDVRTRRVPNRVWVFGGAVALAILGLHWQDLSVRWTLYLGFLPIAVLFFDALWDRPAVTSPDAGRVRIAVVAMYVAAGLALAFVVVDWLLGGVDDDQFFVLMSVIGMVLVAYLFYAVGLLRGGADAKAFMTIAVLVPVYPATAGLPLFPLDPRLAGGVELVFPFAFVTLLNAALLSLFIPLAFLVRNAVRRNLKFPLALFGLRVPLDRVPEFSWLMERVVDGEVQVRLMPRGRVDRDEELGNLEEAGREDVWVTPQIPFIVLMFLGFLTAFVIGNFMFIVLGAAT